MVVWACELGGGSLKMGKQVFRLPFRRPLRRFGRSVEAGRFDAVALACRTHLVAHGQVFFAG